jgi:NifB/MoaA-like Fe-S oxidoreductase
LNYDGKIVQFLSGKDVPCDVEKIRVAADIGNWNTALKHLLELFIDGKISGQKTSRGWIFWKKGADAV